MRYRTLGERGRAVSVVGVGGNDFGARLDENSTNAVVHASLDAGLPLFDTADMYGGTRSGRGDGERRSAHWRPCQPSAPSSAAP